MRQIIVGELMAFLLWIENKVNNIEVVCQVFSFVGH